MTTRNKIIAAAEAGKIVLADLEGGVDFDSVEEWTEYAADSDIEDVAIRFGLIKDARPDICEINRQANRRLAQYASIRGA